jgi:uncharacterized protein
MKAVRGGDAAVVNRLLREPALSADRRGPRGNSALTYAILYGHAEMVEALIEGGADVNVVRANGATRGLLADYMYALALAMPETGGSRLHHDHPMRTRAEAVTSYTRVRAALEGADADKAAQCHHDT